MIPIRLPSLLILCVALGFGPARPAAAQATTSTAGITAPGSTAYPPHKPAPGSPINWQHPLATGLVSAVPLSEGEGTTFYDAVNMQSYPARTLAGTPAGAQPPAWLSPPLTPDYPWLGPAISNNGATAQAIQSSLAWQDVINNVNVGYSYATLVQPLDTSTFGRIMDATGAAVVTLYLNIPNRLGLVSTTWRNASGAAINPTAPFTVNQWTLVLCTVQPGQGVMYLNGVAAASDPNVNLAKSWANQTGMLVYNTTGNGAMMCNANFSSWWIWNNRVLNAQEAAQFYANPWGMFEAGQRGMIKGTKVTLGAPAVVRNACFYSHAAAGNLRLGIYDNSSPKKLLWQSGVTSNSAAGAWLRVAIGAGEPAALNLSAGDYWLAWQTDSALDVPSYSAGGAGDGFAIGQAFGNFPTTLKAVQPTTERWSMYLEDEPPVRNGIKDFNRYASD